MSTSGGGTHGDDVDEALVELADQQLAALHRDGVGEPGAAEVVVDDPVPVDPAESSLFMEDLEAERDAAEGLRRDRLES